MIAVTLFSGGLDSQLSIKIMQEQGIEVVGLFIDNGFLQTDLIKLKQRAKDLNLTLHVLDIKSDFITRILFNPKYGYGKNGFNPCLDCHENYIKVAWKFGLKYYGLDNFFIVTGDVVGQRGMSQTTNQLNRLTKSIGKMSEYVLRPLSAKILDITIPEKMGIVDRTKLYSIRDKSRKQQLTLVTKYNITEFETPGGGCLLTESAFSKRLKTLSSFKNFETHDIKIPSIGRHFQIGECYLIISRNEQETIFIENYKNDTYIKLKQPKNITGPTALMYYNNYNLSDITTCISLLLDYGKTDKNDYCEYNFNEDILYIMPDDKTKYIKYLIH